MKIIVCDWMGGKQLNKIDFYHNQQLEGDDNEIFRIARHLFSCGLNVMIQNYPSKNTGTKKNPVWTESGVIVWVDTKNFSVR